MDNFQLRACLFVALATTLAMAMAAPATTVKAQTASSSVELAGHRLQQVAMTTRDLPRSIAFYRNTLGLPFLFETNGMAFFDVAGTRLMIALDSNRPTGRPSSILYFEALDFQGTIKKLRSAEVTLDGPVETVQRTASGELRLQQFRDPDGNALAILGTLPR